ncbi:MAG TPA: glycosyltransferase family 4 protein [Azospirillum sp.]
MHDAAIFLTEGTSNTGPRLFGKDVANAGLIRALVGAQTERPLHFCVADRRAADAITAQFGFDKPTAARVRPIAFDQITQAPGVDVLMHGQPNIYHFAWQRRPEHARAFSLCGLIHTMAPPATQEVIGKVLTTPVQPWDALVCTSRAVLHTVRDLLDGWGEFHKTRFGGSRVPEIQLPIIPLGVDCAKFERTPDRLAKGREWRKRLRIQDDDVAILWMGRLSFFEKMHPFATLAAAEMAARRTSRKLHLIFAGWFPHEAHEAQYRQLATAFAPSVTVHFVDGNTPDVQNGIWFAADVFTSLVDNVQETFGLAPVEAMAAGLPSVVSDWDGYRDTVTEGEAGFRIRTIMPPPGSGFEMVRTHASHHMSYQHYVGAVAQSTAVDIEAAAAAFATLAEDAGLRRQFGEAARTRALQVFDWPVVARQYRALWADLATVRADAAEVPHPGYPLMRDPYALFANFASESLGRDSVLALADESAPARLAAVRGIEINTFARFWQADAPAMQALLERIAAAGTLTVGQLEALAPGDPSRLHRSLGWLLKMGLVRLVSGGAA